MKHIFTLILITSFSFIFGQTDLYVSDNSFIYVDGTAFTSGPNVAPLYVTNNVELDGANSYLYLRKEAQLLQNIASGNSGTGKLSVIQTGTSNTYMYNYWCSPVGNTMAGDAVNRPFRADNILYDPIGDTNPALNPITSATPTFVPGYDGTPTVGTTPQAISHYWLYTFSMGSTVYADWKRIRHTGEAVPGLGFTMKGNSSASQKYDFRGKANNGIIEIPIVNGEEVLVGNPYPSAMDARTYIHDINNASLIDSGTLMFWEQDPNSSSHVLVAYRGGYATYTINESGPVVETFAKATFESYNGDGTLNTVGPSGPTSTTTKQLRRYIPIGQGFMVKSVGNGNLRTTNAMRTFQKESGGFSEFFRTTNEVSRETEATSTEAQYNEDGLFIVPEGYKRFRLNIDFNETYTRQLLQNFHYTATLGEDYGLETLSPDVLNSDVYWPQNGKSLNAQANNFAVDLRIPLVITIANNQPIRFRMFDIQNFDANQPIYIYDNENGMSINLRETNYEINLPQGTYTDRFEITFSANALNIDQVVTAEDLNIYQNNYSAELSIANPKLLKVKQVRLYDVSGKQIFNETNLSPEASYRFSTKNLSQGIYIANITFADNQVVSKKVVISNK
ncbi:MAG: T9SS type A sorting domain-containing protein [Xanthomarina sp.]